MFGQWMGNDRIDLELEKDIRIIGFRRSNQNRTSDVYMIRECDNCHAILEFPSNEVSSESNNGNYREYIICPNCINKVIVLS